MSAPLYSKYLASRFAGHRRYFRHGHWLGRWKWFLTWCVLGAMAAGLYYAWRDRDWLKAQTTHGELAGVHALWEHKCEACHRPPQLENTSLASVLDPGKRWLDLNCQACHAAPAHHASAVWKPTQSDSCAACHHDHQGRNSSLVRLADSHCVQCHDRLNDHHASAKTSFAPSITDFTLDHPEFASVAKQEIFARRMYFSHIRHMTPGLIQPGEQSAAKDAWTLEKIPEKYRDLYRQANQPDQLVRLECASCHQLDAATKLSMNNKLRSEGTYFQPIQFSAHCQTCHSGQLQTAHPLAGLIDQGSKKALPRMLELPHGLQPDVLEQYLHKTITADLMAVKGQLTDLPGRTTTRLDNNQEVSRVRREELRNEVESLLSKVQKAIYDETPAKVREQIHTGSSHCLHCHLIEGINPETRPQRIVRPEIPAVWNTSAKFNHVSHRGVSCVECHQGTVAESQRVPIEKERLHLPGRENCLQCHGPERRLLDPRDSLVKPRGGVRYGCTDCHRYHNGDHPQQGLGSRQRDPVEPRLKLEEYLRGISAQPNTGVRP